MKRLKLTAIAGLTAVAAVLATQVQAQQTNEAEQTFLTFSAPVEMPGVVLEPGTYEFRLANPVTSRNVVQVFKKDSNEPIGQWTFVDAVSRSPSGKADYAWAKQAAATSEPG